MTKKDTGQCYAEGYAYQFTIMHVMHCLNRNSALEISQHCQIPLPSSPSCMYYFSLSEELGPESKVMAIGMYDSSVSLYSLDSQRQLVIRQVIGKGFFDHNF
jgi:hypothetical protein